MANKPSWNPNSDRYERIPYRRCGTSGLKLPIVSLGLWHNFGGDADPRRMRDIIFTAFDLGISHFDLANNYGPPAGSAEENFGDILATDLAAYRDELIISSKAGYYMWPGPYGEFGTRKYLLASLDQSLRRLALDYVDIFYSHRYDPDTPLEETMGALATAVKQGKALYAGISNYPAEQTRQAAKLLRDMGTPCLINQPSYSILNRWIEPELVDAVGETGMGCIVFSPLAQGLLTGKYLGGIPANSRAAGPSEAFTPERLTEDANRRVRGLAEIAGDRGQTLSQLALSWVLRDTRITSALIGASRPEQVIENAAIGNKLLFTDEELRRIEEFAVKPGERL